MAQVANLEPAVHATPRKPSLIRCKRVCILQAGLHSADVIKVTAALGQVLRVIRETQGAEPFCVKNGLSTFAVDIDDSNRIVYRMAKRFEWTEPLIRIS